MVIQRYQDLDAWQLANELKQKVYALIDTSPAKRDGRFCDQLRGAVSAAPSNLAEGFGYYEHPQFARHARIAKASLDEAHNHLHDGVDRKHWKSDDIAPLLVLANRAAGATTRLLAYLTSTDAPRPHGEPRMRRPRRRRR